jgi:hypothetical protein
MGSRIGAASQGELWARVLGRYRGMIAVLTICNGKGLELDIAATITNISVSRPTCLKHARTAAYHAGSKREVLDVS